MWLDDFRRRTAWNAYANGRRYDAPPDPWAFVYVDPESVEHWTTVSLKWGLGRVRGGDWDRPANCRALESLYIEEGLTQRFEQGREWSETTYYETVVDRIADGRSFHGVESVEELEDSYLPAVDGLYESMREEGYRPNRGTVYSDPEDADYVHDLEPMVLFGREGEPIWTEGYHRLVMARLVGVERIPVYVLRRHERWQRTREVVGHADDGRPDVAARTDHPDLQDLAANSP
jgi:hypothetical protein